MKTTFQKTLLAVALSALFSSAAIAADDYSNTIDGNSPGSDKQNMDESTGQSNTHEQQFNETIDGNPPATGDTSTESNRDMHKPMKDHVQHNKSTNRPLTDHQNTVIEEEEEEEEAGQMRKDKVNVDANQQMDETPYGATGAGKPASTGGLLAMSADDLTGMNVVTSDGEDVGSVKNIVISPDNQKIHAVVNVGGILGLGASTILIPLEDFTHKDDKLHVNATEAELEAMTDYGSADFVTLEGDAALSTALRPRKN